MSNVFSINGSAIVAMKGKDCVAIATDTRFGIEAQMISTEFQKVFEMGPGLYVGLAGLATDVQTVAQKLQFRVNLYELRENRRMTPEVFGRMLSNLLYSRRFSYYFINPVVAGMHPVTGSPFVCSMDLIGSYHEGDDFAAAGTCDEQLLGLCETLWEPNLGPDELFEVISQTVMNAFDRDALSGWGAIVHIIEKGKITTRRLKARLD